MNARKTLSWILGLILVVGGVVVGVSTISSRLTYSIPPVSSSVTVMRPTPDVLVAVRALARLESVSYHMERIIDLSDKQSSLFGLIESEDALLLVAVANVTAGVDLQKLTADDIDVDKATWRVRLRLPDPEILSAALDNEHTYVHTRRTGLLAQRKEDLETRARVEAERALIEAARQSGIMEVAARNARQTVEALLRSLGFVQIEVVDTMGVKDSRGFVRQ